MGPGCLKLVVFVTALSLGSSPVFAQNSKTGEREEEETEISLGQLVGLAVFSAGFIGLVAHLVDRYMLATIEATRHETAEAKTTPRRFELRPELESKEPDLARKLDELYRLVERNLPLALQDIQMVIAEFKHLAMDAESPPPWPEGAPLPEKVAAINRWLAESGQKFQNDHPQWFSRFQTSLQKERSLRIEIVELILHMRSEVSAAAGRRGISLPDGLLPERNLRLVQPHEPGVFAPLRGPLLHASSLRASVIDPLSRACRYAALAPP